MATVLHQQLWRISIINALLDIRYLRAVMRSWHLKLPYIFCMLLQLVLSLSVAAPNDSSRLQLTTATELQPGNDNALETRGIICHLACCSAGAVYKTRTQWVPSTLQFPLTLSKIVPVFSAQIA